MISAWWDTVFSSWSPSLDGLCGVRRQGRAADEWSTWSGWESAQLKLFWLFDGITVPLQMENWDSSGIWSGLFAFPQQGKRKGENLTCKVEEEKNNNQNYAVYLEFKWLHIKLPLTVSLLIATIHEKWLYFSSEISQSSSSPLEFSYLNHSNVLF